MSNFGAKVSEETYDVMLADESNLLLNTKYKALKYVENTSMSVDGTSTETEYTHGLSYTPMAWGWIEHSDGWYMKSTPSTFRPTPTLQSPEEDSITSLNLFVRSDSSKIYAKADYSGTAYIEYLADRAYTDTGDISTKESYGIKMSKDDTDVTNVTPYDSVFSSSFNTYKIYDSGTITVEWAEDEGVDPDWKNFDVAHNLGYVPKCIVFDENGQEPVWTSMGWEGQELNNWYVNTTTLRMCSIRYDIMGLSKAAYSQDFTYFIFLDSITDTDFD